VIASGNDLDLDDGLIVLPWRHGHQEPLGRLAYVDPSRAFPAAGEAGPKLAAQPKVASDIGEPARQPPRISQRRPQVIGVRVEASFHADDNLALNGTYRPHERIAGSGARKRHLLLLRSFFPRAISVCSAFSRYSHSDR
jgi:hypothetical protein